MEGFSRISWSQEREERIDSYLQSREDFPLDYLSFLNISFTQKEQEYIAGAYKCFWLQNYSSFGNDLENPPSCKGTPFELWGLMQYFSQGVPTIEREPYRKRIERIYKGKISDDVWGQLMRQCAPMIRNKIEPLVEEILSKISRSFVLCKPFEVVHNSSLSNAVIEYTCPVLKAIRPFLRDFPLKTDDLKYAYPFLSQRKQDLSVSHTRLLFAQYIGNVVYVSPEPVGTPMEIWFLLEISQNAGILSQQTKSYTLREAALYLSEVYTNPRNPKDPDSLLRWIDSDGIIDNIGQRKYLEFLQAQQSPPTETLGKLGMYVAKTKT